MVRLKPLLALGRELLPQALREPELESLARQELAPKAQGVLLQPEQAQERRPAFSKQLSRQHPLLLYLLWLLLRRRLPLVLALEWQREPLRPHQQGWSWSASFFQ